MSKKKEWSVFNALGMRVAMDQAPRRYFAEKRVLVTGATSGIGRGCAIWLLNQGARVALVGRDREELETIGKKFPNQAISIECDFTSDRQQYDMVLAAIEQFGGLDILINAAGVVFEGDLESTFPQDHDYVMDINLRAVYHITHLCQSFLAKSKGCIVNVSCEWGSRPQAGMISYCMSKAGLEMLTKCLALEMAPVRVNAVAPGYTNTNLFRYCGLKEHEIDILNDRMASRNPMGRIAFPDDVVKAIMFLCSKRSNNITGQIIAVDGGQSLTSSLFVKWDKTMTMNAKFAPTGMATIPKVLGWVNEAMSKIRPHVKDEIWLQRKTELSNWTTNLADAHYKITDDYATLDKQANLIANYGMMKDDNGMIYTGENPRAARFEAGSPERASFLSNSSPRGRGELVGSISVHIPPPNSAPRITSAKSIESSESGSSLFGGNTFLNRGENLLKLLGTPARNP